MDGALLSSGKLLIVTQSVSPSYIILLHHDGLNWTTDSLNYPSDNNYTGRDIDLQYAGGNLYLVFSDPATSPSNNLSTINFTYSIDNGINWAPIDTIDNIQAWGRTICTPRLTYKNGKLILTYMNLNYPSKIFWQIFENNEWNPQNSITLPDGNYAWFPQIAVLPSDKILFVWSNSYNGRIELKKEIVDCVLDSPTIPDSLLSLNDKIYPNPFTKKISLKNMTGCENYELINKMGQTIWSGEQIERQDFSALVPGSYFLRVNVRNSIQTIKLIKQ